MPQHHEQTEQSDTEKIRSLSHTLYPGKQFKCYRDLCNYFNIKVKGGNSKKSQLAEFARYFRWERSTGTNIHIISEVFSTPLPKIDRSFLESELYPRCSFLLLCFLASKYTNIESNNFHIMTRRSIMRVMFICNDNYKKANTESLNEISKTDSESDIFINEAGIYLYKEADRILNSMRLRGFLSFDKVYIVLPDDSANREATNEETTKINDYYNFILTNYNFINKYSIGLSKHKKEINRKLINHLGFSFYTAIKFNLTADLIRNVDYLRNEANLTEKCGFEINSLICNKVYNLTFEHIIKIQNKKPKLGKKPKELPKTYIYDNIFFEQLLNTKIEKELNTAFAKEYNFNLDNNIVKERLKRLVNQFIRVNGLESEITK